MATPNEQKKEDAEVYPVIVLDPNGNEYTKGITAWLTAIAKQNPKNLVCIARGPDPEKNQGSPCTPLCDGKPKALSFPKLPDT